MGVYAEGGQAAVRFGALALALATALAFAVSFGICSIGVYILRGLFSFTEDTVGALIGWVPGVGKWVNSKLVHAEQKLTHWVGQAAAGSEAAMGDAFHATAVVGGSIGHEIMGQAIAIWHLTQWTSHVAWIALRGHETDKQLAFQLAANEHRTKYLSREQALQGKAIAHADSPPIGAGIATRTKPIRASVGHTTTVDLPGLRARNRVRDQTVPQSIEGLRAHVIEAERGIDRLWDKVKHLDKVTAGVLASALVATALARLGAGWIRCSNVGRIGRRLCGLDTRLLEALLGAATITFVVSDLCEFTHLLSQAMQRVEPLLLNFVKAEDALIGCHGATKPPDLPLRRAALPPLQTAAALPSL